MLFTPEFEPGFRKAAVIVFAGHTLLFGLIWLIPAAQVSAPRPITVRLQTGVEEPVVQKAANPNPRIVKPVTSISQLPVPAEIASAPVAVKSHTPTTNTVSASKSTLPESASSSPSRATEASASPATPAVLGGAEDRQVLVSANCPGNRKPDYPRISKQLGEQGTVMLELLIAQDGRVTEVSLIKTSGSSRLDRSALETVREWNCIPARKGGKPIEVRGELSLRFTLSD